MQTLEQWVKLVPKLLKRLNDNGDADVEELTSTRWFPMAKGVGLRLLRNADGFIELAVIFGEYTTSTHWKDAYWQISEVRDQLLKSQGPNPGYIRNTLLTPLAELRQKGLGYDDLAERVNDEVVLRLCRAAVDMASRKSGDRWIRSATLIPMAIWNGKYKGVRAKSSGTEQTPWDLINADIWDCMRAIGKKRWPWVPGGELITGDMMREALRQWAKEQKGKPKTEIVPQDGASDNDSDPGWQAAARLMRSLEKTG